MVKSATYARLFFIAGGGRRAAEASRRPSESISQTRTLRVRRDNWFDATRQRLNAVYTGADSIYVGRHVE